MEESRPDEVKRIVHTLRPQLVERDTRFAPLCDHVLHGSSDADPDLEHGYVKNRRAPLKSVACMNPEAGLVRRDHRR
ncbi:MAG: hypothetical protein IPJ85_16275 [Flavobacteriales bacterium]|nr:hypothetical protein [Flavobacteriales bacterium]